MAEHIDPIGDVILVVGPEPPKRLRVSSACLSKASSTFRAMFSGRFAEGQTLSSFSPEHISLPDDNAETMRILLGIVHNQNPAFPLALDPATTMLQIARLADKYDLASAASSPFHLLFIQIAHAGGLTPIPISIDDVTKLVEAAYLCRNHYAFRVYTRRLARDYSWTVGSLLDEFHGAYIPDGTLLRAILSCDKQRNNAFEALEAEMAMLSQRLCCCSSPCGLADTILSQLKSWLRGLAGKDESVGYKQASLSEVLDRMSRFKLFDGGEIPSWFKKHVHSRVDVRLELSRRVAMIGHATFGGLCLECLCHRKDDSENVCLEHEEDPSHLIPCLGRRWEDF